MAIIFTSVPPEVLHKTMERRKKCFNMKQTFISDVCKDNICLVNWVVLKKAAIFSVCIPCTKTKEKPPTNMCSRELWFHSTTTVNIRQRHTACMTLPLQQTGPEFSIKCNSTWQHALNSTFWEMFICVLYEFESATNHACGLGKRSRYSDLQWARRSRDQIPVGARFSTPTQTGPEAHPASCTKGTGSFPSVKRPGRGVEDTTASSAEVKERVELYLYPLSGPSWPVLG